MVETYRMAERTIRITSLYERVHTYCRDYRAEGEPDFCVETTQADIDYERNKSAQEYARDGVPVPAFGDGYLEELAVYRQIAERMPQYDTILFHSSVVAVDGEAYAFTAKSGTGKSTHARLWRELFKDRAVMVNDDKPLIRITETGAIVYGTPYNGKHRLGANIAVPLKAICILERAPENHIERISGADAYLTLLQQTYRPKNPDNTVKTLQLLDRLTKTVALYRLGCNMEPEAAAVSYNGMQG